MIHYTVVIMAVDKCACAVCCHGYLLKMFSVFLNRSRQVESRKDWGLLCKLKPEPNAWLPWPEADLKIFSEGASQLLQRLNIFDGRMSSFKSNIHVEKNKNIKTTKWINVSLWLMYLCKKKETNFWLNYFNTQIIHKIYPPPLNHTRQTIQSWRHLGPFLNEDLLYIISGSIWFNA